MQACWTSGPVIPFSMPTPCTPDSRDGIGHRIRGVWDHSSQGRTITLCNCTVLCCLSESYIHRNKPTKTSYSISHRISQENDIQKEIYLVAWLLIALFPVLFLKFCVPFKNKAWHRNWMTELSIRGHLATLKKVKPLPLVSRNTPILPRSFSV